MLPGVALALAFTPPPRLPRRERPRPWQRQSHCPGALSAAGCAGGSPGHGRHRPPQRRSHKRTAATLSSEPILDLVLLYLLSAFRWLAVRCCLPAACLLCRLYCTFGNLHLEHSTYVAVHPQKSTYYVQLHSSTHCTSYLNYHCTYRPNIRYEHMRPLGGAGHDGGHSSSNASRRG